MIEKALLSIWLVLMLMFLFKDMSGKEELRRIREELEKMNKHNER